MEGWMDGCGVDRAGLIIKVPAGTDRCHLTPLRWAVRLIYIEVHRIITLVSLPVGCLS